MAAKRGRCPHCQSTVTVPSLAPSPEAEEKIEVAEREETRLFKQEETPEGLRRCPACDILVEKSARSCPRCGTDLSTGEESVEAATLPRRTREKPTLHPASFWAALPYVLTYPFNLKGMFILILGAVLIYIVGIIQLVLIAAGPLGFLAQLFVAVFTFGYVGSYMFRIIEETGGGGDLPPSLPGLADYVDEIITPFWQILATFLASLAPLILYWIFSAAFHFPTQKAVLLVLFIYALVSFPMALTAMAMSGSVSKLNPVLIVGFILKVPLHYLGALVFIALMLAAQSFSRKVSIPQVPFLSAPLTIFISLYFLMVNMRVLGLIYRYNEEKLG